MKTLIASLALSLMVVGTSFASSDTHPTDTRKTAMQTAVYPTAGSMKINVIIDNATGHDVTVRILDKKGSTLAIQKIGKVNQPTISRFDLSELQDGVYEVEISTGDIKEIKQVTLTTNPPSVTSLRSVVLL